MVPSEATTRNRNQKNGVDNAGTVMEDWLDRRTPGLKIGDWN
jgi:hypothetical protein